MSQRTNTIKQQFTAVVAGLLLARGPALADEPPDHAAELQKLRPLAAQGHAVAQFNLGVMHDFGQGVAQDPVQAVYWYRLAAAQGHAAAQFNLGGMYFDGAGVARDYTRAYMWFTLGAAAGAPGAARNRSSITKIMTPAQITQARQMAADCQARNFQACD